MAKKPNWSPEENALLVTMAGNVRNDEIARKVGRTREAVAQHIRGMGMKSFRPVRIPESGLNFGKYPFWTEDSDAEFVRLAPGSFATTLAIHFGRTSNAIRHKARELGVKLQPSIRKRTGWTHEAEELLRSMVDSGKGVIEIGVVCGKSKTAVYKKAADLGIAMGSSHWWTLEDEKFLRDHGPSMTATELKAKLGRGDKTIRWKAKSLGVTLRPFFHGESQRDRAARKRLERGNLQAVSTQRKASARDPRPLKQETVRLPAPTARPTQARRRPDPMHVPRLAWCESCGSPVVNTISGWIGHKDRVGCKRDAYAPFRAETKVA